MESPAARGCGHSTADAISYLKAPKLPVNEDPTLEYSEPSELRVQIEQQAQDLAKQRQEMGELRARLHRCPAPS